MNTKVRRKLEMANRVREFTRAHAADEPGYVPVLAKFDELLTRAFGIVARQIEGQVAARVARARRDDLRQVVHSQLVHYLVAVGSVAARDQTELSLRFRLPGSNVSNTAFLASVKNLLTAAEGQRELLLQDGMMPSLLEDLNKLVVEFETAVERKDAARRNHIGARVDLEDITAELVEQINVLDGVTRYRFGKDPEVMAEWKAARQILGQPLVQGTPVTAGSGKVTQAADAQQTV